MNMRKKILKSLYSYLSESNTSFIEFVSQFVGEIKNVAVEFNIGKKSNDGFLSYLNSYVDNIVVKFSDKDNEPLVYFYDYNKSKNITCINLNAIRNIDIRRKNGVNCDIVIVDFSYINDIDYCLKFKI